MALASVNIGAMKNSGTTAKSRAGKPAALTPALVAECGLRVAAAQGVGEVSIRKIAEELGVSPMAIYRHFADKEALLAAMLDLFILRADVLPKQALPWQAWLEHTGMAMYRALCDAPSWIPLFGRLQLKPGALSVVDAWLGVMVEAGFSRQQAAQSVFSVLQLLIGAATLYTAFHDPHQASEALSGFDAQEYFNVGAALGEMAVASSANHMHSGLRVLIVSLEQELQRRQG